MDVQIIEAWWQEPALVRQSAGTNHFGGICLLHVPR